MAVIVQDGMAYGEAWARGPGGHMEVVAEARHFKAR